MNREDDLPDTATGRHEGTTSRYDAATERTFAAQPPARGGSFARTWWGRAWLAALEDGALDSAQVRAGRRLARAGAVGAVSVRPGRVTAVVRDRDGTGQRADVLLTELSEGQWDRLLDLAVERSGDVAALLDGEMPPRLVEDAATAGIDLLPGLGELEASCGCGAWDHCGHTAALCYQVARLLDEDPFVLLLLRGRSPRAVLDDLQARGTAAAPPEPAAARPRRDGVDAAQAYAAARPPLPAPPELPGQPGLPPSLDAETPPAAGVDPTAVEFLAARTADEAHRMLAEASAPRTHACGELTADQDAVRLAAGLADSPRAFRTAVGRRLATGSGRSREGLASAVLAWRYGGAEALSVLEEEWAVEDEAWARARRALESAWEDDERPVLRARGNRWTVVGTSCQLRLDRDGRWWPYRKERERWSPAGDAARDPATALATALSFGDGDGDGSGGEDTGAG
ncbi:SWF or SNF family helicase [Streptomyces longwoodensis]|uniref:SWIM zinc finger family protein n=1 Tax=Streptomyces longwoodensis TaxID=68231 RepID=UPI0033FF1D03